MIEQSQTITKITKKDSKRIFLKNIYQENKMYFKIKIELSISQIFIRIREKNSLLKIEKMGGVVIIGDLRRKIKKKKNGFEF